MLTHLSVVEHATIFINFVAHVILLTITTLRLNLVGSVSFLRKLES